ncbi:hypothetical protein [Mycobacterium avium]|uniref:hypothetical protein n=1 Tax=Mycobacterium avium TaxID=1764 RepID=UPI000A06268B|nr:hypothetical protein [Mycobacterium avium]
MTKRQENSQEDPTSLTKKRRSGSETRQRNHQVKLSLLGVEHARLQQLARDAGLPNIQQYILHRLEPDLVPAS